MNDPWSHIGALPCRCGGSIPQADCPEHGWGEHGQRAAAAYKNVRPAKRCEALARKGTGHGTCDEPLDKHGQMWPCQ